jgi:hypothetical protein
MGIGIAAAGLFLSVTQTQQARRRAKSEQARGIAFDARTARLESKAILEEAELEATEIRREGELLGKKQTALTAKAGLKLGRGTAADIQAETRRLTAKDVSTTLEAAQRKSKQLLETFPEGGVATVERRKLEQLRASEAELTALQSGAPSNANFIRSPKKPRTALTGL